MLFYVNIAVLPPSSLIHSVGVSSLRTRGPENDGFPSRFTSKSCSNFNLVSGSNFDSIVSIA